MNKPDLTGWSSELSVINPHLPQPETSSVFAHNVGQHLTQQSLPVCVCVCLGVCVCEMGSDSLPSVSF